MKRHLKLSLLLLSVLIISVFTTSCGFSSFFVSLNNIVYDIFIGSTDETVGEETTETETESEKSTTEETTVQEISTEEATVEQTVGLTNSDNIEVDNTPAATETPDTPSGTVITAPEVYSVSESVTAAGVVASLNPSTAYSAVRTFHDWIVSNTYYYYESDYKTYNNADGVFTYGKSVCLGYSLAFEALMDEWSKLHPEAGVECKVAYGDDDPSTTNILHAWNLVKINDAWYNIDVTWDDTTESYDFFLLSDTTIQQTREVYWVDNYETPPACTSTAYEFGQKDYGISKTVALNNLSEFSNAYYNAIQEGYTSVTFFYSSTENLNDIVVTYDVWRALSLNDKNHLVFYQHWYQDPLGSNYLINYASGSYSNYYFFTIIASKE